MLANQDVCPNCLESIHRQPASTPAVNHEAPVAEPVEKPAAEEQQQTPAPKKKHNGILATLVVALVIALGIAFVGYYFYRHT